MATHTYDDATFRSLYPAFADTGRYTAAALEIQYADACNFVSPNDGCFLSGAALDGALYAMTAHLQALSDLAASGQTAAIVKSSSVGKVSVSVQAPPVREGDAYNYWLSLTPYGLKLRALFKAASAGGFYAGGRPERLPFRKVGGAF